MLMHSGAHNDANGAPVAPDRIGGRPARFIIP